MYEPKVAGVKPRLCEVTTCRAIGGDDGDRRNVVRGHAVAEHGKRARADDVGHLVRPASPCRRRTAGAGCRCSGRPNRTARLRLPAAIPTAAARVAALVALEVQLGRQVLLDRRVDFLVAGPDVAQEHGLAVVARTERLARQIDERAPGQRIRHDQWWRDEIARARERMDAAFEVAVARQHRRHHEVAALDVRGHLGRERAGVAHAGGAAVAGKLVAQRVQRLLQAGGGEVVGHRA